MGPAQSSTAAAPMLPLRDRIIVWTALSAITLICWIYLVRMPMSPSDLGGFAGRLLSALSPGWAELWLTLMMWAVMMVAMMLPSASPMVMMYARMARGRSGAYLWPIVVFASAYVVVWIVFSVIATAGQAALQRAALISNALSAGPIVGGTILIAAGVYQLTPLKNACLGHCRSPIGFFMTEWRDGAAGAMRMGLKHGAFCVGCCWMLMLLLFVAGVMNLAWVAAISIFVLVEKTVPWGKAVAVVSGVALLAGGVTLVFYRWL